MNRSRALLFLAVVLAAAVAQLSGASRAYAPPTSPTFTNNNAGLTGVQGSSVAWGDYDSNGKLDILLTGNTGSAYASKIYRNEGDGSFSEDTTAESGLARVFAGSVAWGDYNSDGKLDILLTGSTGTTYVSKIYKNNGNGTFTEDGTAESGLTGVYWSSVAWGDYNSDGKPDILLTGDTASTQVTKIFKNNGNGTFSEDTTAEAGLIGIGLGSVAWGDYNSDGKPDIVLTGSNSLGRAAKIYKNNGNGTFSEDTTAESGLTGVNMSSVAWGDYNSDGKPDLALTGYSGAGPISKIYKNNGNGTFSEDTTAESGLAAVYMGSVAWGDYNSDGKPDILLTGDTASTQVTKIFKNNGNGTFSEDTAADSGLTGVSAGPSSVAWGDYNPDGKLDILLTGWNSYNSESGEWNGSTNVASVYHSHTSTADTVPSAPTNLSASVGSNGVALSWNAASDSQTPAAALNYNLRVGTTAGGSNIVSPLSLANGTRLVAKDGNVGERTDYTLKGLHAGVSGTHYYWSVQAVDTSFVGSAFATEGKFTVYLFPPTGKFTLAKLSKTSFPASRAGKVKLTCKFSPRSKVFRYVLSLKKGKKWTVVKRVSKTGFYKAKYTISVKKLFAGKKIKRGRYRLKLSADKNSKTLRFTIT